MITMEAHYLGANIYLAEDSGEVISITGPYPKNIAFRHVVEGVADTGRKVVMRRDDYEVPILTLLAMLV